MVSLKNNFFKNVVQIEITRMFQFNFTEAIRMFFMVADVRLVSMDADEPNSGWNGEVPIFDMAGFGLRHVTCVVLSVLRIYMKYTQVRSSQLKSPFKMCHP